PTIKSEKVIQNMLKRYPELNSAIIGHAQPSRRSRPELEKLVPSRADRAAEEGSRRRPSQPKRAA
ncbi:MAG: hypothetical protein M1530_01925, partial [Candidatus Marsarchaeota archaeon]|nr:hypothetical protein [Candidatus Marsarchaeota archaeon]